MNNPITGVHPYADKFPMLPPDEIAELAASISEVGLLQPITVDPDGLILDGRNRYAACQQAGVVPTVTVYDGDAADFVIASNVARRHMTTEARAMATAALQSQARRDAALRDMHTEAKAMAWAKALVSQLLQDADLPTTRKGGTTPHE